MANKYTGNILVSRTFSTIVEKWNVGVTLLGRLLVGTHGGNMTPVIPQQMKYTVAKQNSNFLCWRVSLLRSYAPSVVGILLLRKINSSGEEKSTNGGEKSVGKLAACVMLIAVRQT